MKVFNEKRDDDLKRKEMIMMDYRIIQKNVTMSTNNDIKSYFDTDEKEGLVVVAKHQTHGRGRSGVWFDDSEGMLLMSILLRPAVSVDAYLQINHCTVDSLITSILSLKKKGKHPFDLKIKWPNDLLLNGKKICGVLQEGVICNNILQSVALGIGINVLTKMSFFQKHEMNHATSLMIENNQMWSKSLLLQTFLHEFSHRYFDLSASSEKFSSLK